MGYLPLNAMASYRDFFDPQYLRNSSTSICLIFLPPLDTKGLSGFAAGWERTDSLWSCICESALPMTLGWFFCSSY